MDCSPPFPPPSPHSHAQTPLTTDQTPLTWKQLEGHLLVVGDGAFTVDGLSGMPVMRAEFMPGGRR